jgi:N-acetylneuraminic acid mutarotase
MGAVEPRWSPISSQGAPTGYQFPVAVAARDHVLCLWGASTSPIQATGAFYEPATDRWFPLTAMPPLEDRKRPALAWTGREILIWGGLHGEKRRDYRYLGDGVRLGADGVWRTIASDGAPKARAPNAVWAGDELMIWSGLAGKTLADAARYVPATDTWRKVARAGAPSGREGALMAWTGREVLVWGGHDHARAPGEELRDGAAYDPKQDRWRAVSPLPEEAPTVGRLYAVRDHIVLVGASTGEVWRYDAEADRWTAGAGVLAIGEGVVTGRVGDEIIVVGREGTAGYDAAGDAWRALPPCPNLPTLFASTPIGCSGELLCFGGLAPGGMRLRLFEPERASGEPPAMIRAQRVEAPSSTSATQSVPARPRRGSSSTRAAADGWQPLPDSPLAARGEPAFAWTSQGLFVGWGRTATKSDANRAATYDPAARAWTALDAPPAHRRASAVGLDGGDAVVMLFGGIAGAGSADDEGFVLDAGGTWRPTPTEGTPTEPQRVRLAWTGSEVLAWTGQGDRPGAAFDPAANRWRSMTSDGAPRSELDQQCVWTGRELVVWGLNDGVDRRAGGGLYDPIADRWRELPPPPQDDDVIALGRPVWTGRELVVAAGTSAAGGMRGAAFDPDASTWRAIAPMPGIARHGHTACWTGRELVLLAGMDADFEWGTDVVAYDPARDTWRELPPLPWKEPRRHFASAWSGDELVVWGGFRGASEPCGDGCALAL